MKFISSVNSLTNLACVRMLLKLVLLLPQFRIETSPAINWFFQEMLIGFCKAKNIKRQTAYTINKRLKDTAPGKVRIYGETKATTTKIRLNTGSRNGLLKIDKNSIRVTSNGFPVPNKNESEASGDTFNALLDAGVVTINLERRIGGPGEKVEVCLEFIAKMVYGFPTAKLLQRVGYYSKKGTNKIK